MTKKNMQMYVYRPSVVFKVVHREIEFTPEFIELKKRMINEQAEDA